MKVGFVFKVTNTLFVLIFMSTFVRAWAVVGMTGVTGVTGVTGTTGVVGVVGGVGALQTEGCPLQV